MYKNYVHICSYDEGKSFMTSLYCPFGAQLFRGQEEF